MLLYDLELPQSMLATYQAVIAVREGVVGVSEIYFDTRGISF